MIFSNMSNVRILQIDAFSNRPFAGNPAAVCLPEDAPDAEWMQSVAAEMNLAETAFVQPQGERFGLRWFTPAGSKWIFRRLRWRQPRRRKSCWMRWPLHRSSSRALFGTILSSWSPKPSCAGSRLTLHC
jgi:hypothetical protein